MEIGVWRGVEGCQRALCRHPCRLASRVSSQVAVVGGDGSVGGAALEVLGGGEGNHQGPQEDRQEGKHEPAGVAVLRFAAWARRPGLAEAPQHLRHQEPRRMVQNGVGASNRKATGEDPMETDLGWRPTRRGQPAGGEVHAGAGSSADGGGNGKGIKPLMGPKLTSEEVNRARDRAPVDKGGTLLCWSHLTHQGCTVAPWQTASAHMSC